jgi:hypothetical protein
MAQESEQIIKFDFQSDALDTGTLELSVPPAARSRFLRNPHRYVREFLERHGQEVNEISFAVSEDGLGLSECFAQLAVAELRPRFQHIKVGEFRSSYVIR